ncbi:filamentous hemagglutinin N-terminal domain-containing protein [Leptolyngbya sp. FACHB-261]|uniref:two-partner secretion domain-containing protein n=1 Tax=Leptolyngbya sp. FACHB-261 TaxID=2692806 RepID=UPI0016823D94|nr:filamentous hemagglutinin N-terminal domain-containing protein [Leptolyngbya sp. FACHB-261]MBD2100340.1 filamentous hemagglutinin N-terminal domain-containing protein [Leptolyngbya sp. FACHB-261]
MNQWPSSVWFLTGSTLGALLCAQPIAAQVVPDNTLPGGERSQVTGNPNFQIDGGAKRGGNLFHSFQQFSVPTGGSAYFNNAPTITTIFTRVTGGSASNIDGLIRANGTANLFLLNPNGILFGPNASLNIGGSFVGTTANEIGFPNGELFSSNATQPLPNQLLNVSPNALFFNQLAAQSIVNRSTANNGIGLQVPAGQSLLLVGGDVRLEGGQIVSPGSRVELGAVAGQGNVGLSETSSDWQLSFPDSVARADVSLNNSAQVNVLAGGGGSITITARNLSLSEASRLRAGINDRLGFAGAQAGDIQLNATEAINLTNSSAISNGVQAGSTGNAGNIDITTGLLSLTEGAQLSSSTFGWGNAGNVNISARDTVSFDDIAVFNTVGPTGVGNAGSINITSGSLSLVRGSQVGSATAGQGDAGSVNITTRDTVLVDGISNGFRSVLVTAVQAAGVGNASSINITSGSLSVTGGALLLSRTAGQGDAGNITISTGSLSVTSGGQLNALTYGQGRAGNVNIMVRDAAVFDGAGINDAPSGVLTGVVEGAVGEGGDLSITAGSLRLTNGAALSANTLAKGSAGNINITVRDAVLIEGIARGGTGIFATVGETGVGNGGTINLSAGSLSLIGDGAIAADTNGQGRGGNINLDVQGTLLLSGGGRAAPTGESSRITLGVQPGGSASGGNLRINAGSLVLNNGGLLKASTQGQADAGNLDIQADRVDISGSVPSSGLPSGLFTSSDTAGNAGDITLQTQTFRIADGAALSARSRGDGQGGDITVNTTRTFEAVNGGQLITTTFRRGQAGTITVNAAEQIMIAGSDPTYTVRLAKFPNPIDPLVANAIIETGPASGFFANTEPNSTGRGGNIQITTGRFTVQEGARLITSTSGSGRAGDIRVSAPDIQLSGAASGLFAQTTTAANAGNLTIQPRGNGQRVRVNLQGGAQISASTSSSGRGGQLTITAPESITLTGNGSIIAAGTEGRGAGGNLRLTTGTLNLQNQAEVSVSSSSTGPAGSLFVEANRIFLNNQGRVRADTSGGGGNINLRSGDIILRRGSNITTNATGSNIPGGDIAIDTQFLVAVPNEDSNISADSEDFRGGNVSINAFAIFGLQSRLSPTDFSDITATGANSALSGTVNVTTAGIDPTSGLVELSTDLVDPSGLIAQGCPADQGNSFVVTGRGGLPPTPEQQLDDDSEWQDRRRLTVAQQTNPAREVGSQKLDGSAQTLHPDADKPITEATGWQMSPTGEVVLVATTPEPTVQNRLNQPVTCKSRQ